MQRKLNFKMNVYFIDEWEREYKKPCVPAPFGRKKRGEERQRFFCEEMQTF